MIELARDETYETFKQWLDSLSRRRLAVYAGAIAGGAALETMGGTENNWFMKIGGGALIIAGACIEQGKTVGPGNTQD
jgi:hypothetical protein